MQTAGKAIWFVIYIGLIGALLLGILRHADQFKVAFGAVSSFFLNEMSMLKS